MKKSWRRIRPSQNGAGVEFDLRPRGKREYYPIKKEAEAAARIARVQHERGKVVVTSAVLPSARYSPRNRGTRCLLCLCPFALHHRANNSLHRGMAVIYLTAVVGFI
jgi:hypothetical protein